MTQEQEQEEQEQKEQEQQQQQEEQQQEQQQQQEEDEDEDEKDHGRQGFGSVVGALVPPPDLGRASLAVAFLLDQRQEEGRRPRQVVQLAHHLPQV